MKTTILCDLMTKYGSDKSNKHRHTYSEFYYNLFVSLKEETINLFELGLGTNNTDVPSNMGASGRPGASLYGWEEFFPNANVYGADVDSRILFNYNRIQTFYCDQTNPDSINTLWSNDILKDVVFDILIEDGLHQFDANLTFLKNSIHKVKKGGYYITEDLHTGAAFENFQAITEDLKKEFNLEEISVINLPLASNPWDNNVLYIKR